VVEVDSVPAPGHEPPVARDHRFRIQTFVENGSTHRAKPMTEFIFSRVFLALPSRLRIAR
jgi:hypothetical protein